MLLVTADQMRTFDRIAIENYGIPGVVLMENAGRSTFELLKNYLGDDLQEMRVSVVSGPGNNGGDGYVIARYLINMGAEVHTFVLSPREKIRGDALVNLQVLEKMTESIIHVTNPEELEQVYPIWDESEIIVDAILGTGLRSEVRSPFKEAILEINKADAVRIAVDIPSGIDADTGRVLGCAVKADLTATYGFMKLGMAVYPGRDYCGHIECVDISIPRIVAHNQPAAAVLYDTPDLSGYLDLRLDPDAHKGAFGHLLIIGGSPGKTGAPAMAAMAASKIGAGLVTVAIPSSLNSILEIKLTEEMTLPVPDDGMGYFSDESIGHVLDFASGKRCVALGPGISTEGRVSYLVRELLTDYDGWLLIDADGLNAIAADPTVLKRAKPRVVVTPHPGEMARLIGETTAEVQSDRVKIAKDFAQEYGVWTVLKGAGTITASPDGLITVNATGNPWMASGGQGDVLSGILGGLLAQGLEPDYAIPLGVYLHGLAADNLVHKSGPAPVTATDVINEISNTLRELSAAPEE